MVLAALFRGGLARASMSSSTLPRIRTPVFNVLRPRGIHYTSIRGFSTEKKETQPPSPASPESPASSSSSSSYSSSSSSSSSTTNNTANVSADEKEKLAFLESLREWNQARSYVQVLKSVEAHPKRHTPEVIDEYVKALIARKGEGESELNQLITRILQEPGRTVGNPLFISKLPKSLWERLLYPVLLIVFLYYVLRGGPLSGFAGRVGEYQQPGQGKQAIAFTDVKGNHEAKDEMQDLVEYLKNPKKFIDLGVKMPKGVLLMGPPGTGKTLIARALAGEAGVPFFYTSGSEFEEMLVGVGAMRIRNLFNHARAHAPCIIFIDEIDAVGGRRDSTETKTKMTLNQLLVELDGFATTHGVLVVAATNLPEVLDPALVRPGRFDRQVHLELPDKKTRHEILDMYLKGKQGEDVNLEVLSRHTGGLSGADLFNIANWAAIEAIKQGQTKVTQHMLENALENAVLGRQRKSLIVSESTKKLTSFHEAGHALVALHTPGAQPIHKATLVPRGHALGMVQQLSNDDLMYSREELLAGLDVAMGGRAAEELIFGPNKVTQGAGSDFQQATRKAKAMVTHLGMSDAIGKVYLDKNDGDISPATQNLVDSEVRKMLDESFKRAQDVLAHHKVELHRLAEALLEHETLSLEDIKLVVAGKPLPPKPLPPPPPPPLVPHPIPVLPSTPSPTSPVATVPVIPIPVLAPSSPSSPASPSIVVSSPTTSTSHHNDSSTPFVSNSPITLSTPTHTQNPTPIP